MNKLSVLPEQFLRNYIGMELLGEKSNFPPHNIEKIDDYKYVLTLAVAGYAKENLSANLVGGKLTIEGFHTPSGDFPGYDGDVPLSRTYLYRGISFRNFKQEYILGENVDVKSISLEHGLLTVYLEKQVPESAKIKIIEIK